MLAMQNSLAASLKSWQSLMLGGLAAACSVAALGCSTSVFNSEFVEIFDSSGTGALATVENATGHVPVIFVNRLRYSPQLVNYMARLNQERRLSGVGDSLVELSDLSPRCRLRVQVTFENGNVVEYEFVSGDGVFEFEPRDEDEIDLGIAPDPVDPNLTENTLTRTVSSCNVARVDIVGNAQVFMPVFIRTINVEVGDLAQQTRTLVTTDAPQFRAVLADEVDGDLNVTLLRNFGVREAPAPAQNLTCGSMVGIVLSGSVSVPFTPPEDDPQDTFISEQDLVPGFVDTDTRSAATIPGRYEFLVTVR